VVAIEIDYAAAVGVPVQLSNASGISLRDVDRVFVRESQAHEDTAPVPGLRFTGPDKPALFGGSRAGADMADIPLAGAITFENGQRIRFGAAIGGDNDAAGRTDCETERSVSRRELVTERGDDTAAGQD